MSDRDGRCHDPFATYRDLLRPIAATMPRAAGPGERQVGRRAARRDVRRVPLAADAASSAHVTP
ncbi:hypothetical protein [Burkholderia vietnamiensis]|uniref:hypothetical protein n=1 Tax=Burkholderia vietnamiensis TaxID=60552 RepID=UPI0011262CCD|nr:hypothetical protein [Burkholderia vietnamiensis]HDR9055579.1 hypothetical protein [Burkholderia vietnamiensis]